MYRDFKPTVNHGEALGANVRNFNMYDLIYLMV